MTDEQLIIDFLTYLERNRGRRPGTIDAYLLRLSRLGEFLREQGASLLSATTEQLIEFAGPELHRQGIRPRSRKLSVSSIRMFYKWAYARSLVHQNPADDLPHPRFGERLPNFWTRSQAEALLMSCDLNTFLGCRDAAVIGILLGCGLRISGLVALNESALRFDRDEEGGELAFLHVFEKGDKERLVPLPDDSVLLLHAYFGHPDLEAIERTLPGGDRVLFVNTRNTLVSAADWHGEAVRLSMTGVRRLLVKRGKLAGIDRKLIHPHAARHSYATELVEAGVDLLTVQALMGHRDAKSTKVYTHLSLRRLKAAVDQGNPLSKIRTPVSGLAHLLNRQR